eukprot:scaffold76276_cov71-Phaeocystis_antarctica.AAC.2
MHPRQREAIRRTVSTTVSPSKKSISFRDAREPSHSRTLTTGKTHSIPNAWCVAPPPRPSGDLLPGAEVVQAAAGK